MPINKIIKKNLPTKASVRKEARRKAVKEKLSKSTKAKASKMVEGPAVPAPVPLVPEEEPAVSAPADGCDCEAEFRHGYLELCRRTGYSMVSQVTFIGDKTIATLVPFKL